MPYCLILRFLLLGLVVLLTVNACDDDKRPAADEVIELRVMTFNIEWGGTKICFDNVVEAIRLSDADLVGIQEAEGNLQRLADDLGWYSDLRNYAISKYPLIDPPGARGQYVYVEVAPGKIVALANVHLPSDPYGPSQLQDGVSLDEVLKLERVTRLPEIAPYLEVLSSLFERQIPVFLTGDFNAPAHTDWTPSMVGSRLFLDHSVAWPVSQAVSATGFVDSWRAVHPDPLTEPGLTWWAGRPPLDLYTPDESDAQDRIDFVWFAGPAKALLSELVGEAGVADVTFNVTPWPSDHRAVVSTFSVVPAEMPDLVTSGRRVYKFGQDIDIIYKLADDAHATMTVVRTGDKQPLYNQAVTGRGRTSLAGRHLSTGHYKVSLNRPDNRPPLQRDFWILDPAVPPRVEVIGKSFTPGAAITIRWSNAPGNRNDYVAVIDAGAGAENEDVLAWAYIHSSPQGELQLNETSAQSVWPLTAGTYVVHLKKDDGYEMLAESATFEIK